jgi:hypothetical protein
MSTPYLILTDDQGTAYSIPDTLWFTGGNQIQSNTSVQNLLYAVGGKQTADGFPQSRKLQIGGVIYDTTNSGSIESTLRDFCLAIGKGGLLSIAGDAISRAIDVRFPEIEYEWDHWPTHVKITITFTCENPFFIDTSYTTTTKIFAGNDSLIVTLSNCDYVINPVIEIDADQGVNVPGVRIKNLNDGGIACNYNDSLFMAGDILIIDCDAGTVKKNSTDVIYNFQPAIFPRLQPGSNEFAYEGAAMTMKISYKKAYAIA